MSQKASDKPKVLGAVKLERREDKELEDLLSKYNMISLKETLENNSITSEEFWELNDEHLKDMGLTIGERIKYNKAKTIEKAKTGEGKKSV